MKPKDQITLIEDLRAEAETNKPEPNLLDPKTVRAAARTLAVMVSAGIDPKPYLDSLDAAVAAMVLDAYAKVGFEEYVMELIRSRCKGMFTFQAGNLAITPCLQREGFTLSTALTEAQSKVNSAMGKPLAKNVFEPLVELAALRHWASETPAQELGRKAKTHPMSPAQMSALTDELCEVYGWDDEVSRQTIEVWLSCLATRVLNPGCPSNFSLVLTGPGGTGKSCFASLMALEAAPASLFSLADARDSKKAMEALTGTSVALLEELDTQANSKKSVAELKALLTTSHLSARAAYGKHTTRFPLACAWVATSNAGLTHGDGAGERRYATLEVGGSPADGQRRFDWLVQNRDRLHSLAWHLADAGVPSMLTPELIELNRPNNQERLIMPKEWEALLPPVLKALEGLIVSDRGVTRITGTTLAKLLGIDPTPTLTRELEEATIGEGWEKRVYHKEQNLRGRHPSLMPPGTDPLARLVPLHPADVDTLAQSVRNSL